MTRIVVPLDGSPVSERAIDTARHFAELMDADVLLVQVLDSNALDPRQRQARDRSLRYLETKREAVPSADVRTLEAPTVVQGLLQLIADEDADLLVMSSHGRTGARELPMGSVTRELVQTCPIPVMVLGAAA